MHEGRDNIQYLFHYRKLKNLIAGADFLQLIELKADKDKGIERKPARFIWKQPIGRNGE